MHRILFIEDDDDIRANVMELLEAEGFVGVAAATGEEGLRLALSDPPDLILCDITLPGMDGYDVIRAVSEYPQTEGVPFIFVSARAERADVRHGMNLGADDYITKPFARVELLEAVQSRLALRGRKPERLSITPRAGVPMQPLTVASGALVIDPVMRDLYLQAARVASGDIAVLILGETGAGKELLAHEVHRSSRASTSLSSRSTARRSPRRCSRASSSDTRRARSRARRTPKRDCSRARRAARSSSTRWATSR